jgi:glyoxylase-like metal-dependent hydrolase (beta-lactamase superfamily II)
MVQGAAGEVDTKNLGRIGNTGFIVGDTGVLAIDTGTSYRHGLVLLDLIRRVTDKPVRLALITHTRPEFLFGAAAYQAQGIATDMHSKAADLMRSRCERCLKRLQKLLGADEMQATVIIKPDHEFEQSYVIQTIGRNVRVLFYGHSSGPGDVALLDEQTGVLFAGGLLDNLRIPDVQDSDLAGWTGALQQLRELPIKAIVPGHGALGSAALIDDVDRYLAQLKARLLKLLQSGTSLLELPDAAALPEFAHWDQYETIHQSNASILFVRLEREQLIQQEGPQK